MDALTSERVDHILASARDVTVLVVGDLMLDQYVVGSVDRISPEAPVPVVRVDHDHSAVGGAANVAANVVALGARCHVVGLVGADSSGERLKDELRALGVDTSGVVSTPTRPTTVKTRVLARQQQVVRFDLENDADVPDAVARNLASAVADQAPGCGVLVMEDYDKGVLVPPVTGAVFREAAASDVPTVVDPKRRRFVGYAGATVFKPNAIELAEGLGIELQPDDPEWMESTRRRLDCEALLLTLGSRGMALRCADGSSLRVPAIARSVYDVSGAGDTVTAVVAVAMAAGATPVEAALLANHAAALEVQKSGVATVSADELRHHYRERNGDSDEGRA